MLEMELNLNILQLFSEYIFYVSYVRRQEDTVNKKLNRTFDTPNYSSKMLNGLVGVDTAYRPYIVEH